MTTTFAPAYYFKYRSGNCNLPVSSRRSILAPIVNPVVSLDRSSATASIVGSDVQPNVQVASLSLVGKVSLDDKELIRSKDKRVSEGDKSDDKYLQKISDGKK